MQKCAGAVDQQTAGCCFDQAVGRVFTPFARLLRHPVSDEVAGATPSIGCTSSLTSCLRYCEYRGPSVRTPNDPQRLHQKI